MNSRYEIRVKGILDGRWTAWFKDLQVTSNGETVISGPVADQAALHGLLTKVFDLGLFLISPRSRLTIARLSAQPSAQETPGGDQASGHHFTAPRSRPSGNTDQKHRSSTQGEREIMSNLTTARINAELEPLLIPLFPAADPGQSGDRAQSGRRGGGTGHRGHGDRGPHGARRSGRAGADLSPAPGASEAPQAPSSGCTAADLSWATWTPSTHRATRDFDGSGAVGVSVGYRRARRTPVPGRPRRPLRRADLDGRARGRDRHRPGADRGRRPRRQGAGPFAVALRARSDQQGPPIRYQLLNQPELDDRQETWSARTFTETPFMTRDKVAASWRHYLGPAPASPYAAPARADDLSGLPPAYIASAEFDPNRDEAIGYAQRLLQAGVPVELHQWPGTFHGSQAVLSAQVSQRQTAELADALRRALAE